MVASYLSFVYDFFVTNCSSNWQQEERKLNFFILYLIYKMKEEEVHGCQIQEWYKKFKSVSIKTKIHELPRNLSLYRWVAYHLRI